MNEREAIRKWMHENPEAADRLRRLYDKGPGRSFAALASDEHVTMICGPFHGGIEGAKQAQCECGAVIWLSPSTQKALAKRGDAPTRLLCMRCGGQAIQE